MLVYRPEDFKIYSASIPIRFGGALMIIGCVMLVSVLWYTLEEQKETERRKNVVAVLDFVSGKLGNSRAICKKYYVHPGLVRLYEENNFSQYLRLASETAKDMEIGGLTSSEKVLLKILKAS